MIFDIFPNVKSPGQVCTNELLLSYTHSQELIPLYNQIAREQDNDKRQALKKRLPLVTWQAHYPSGRRKNDEAEPSGLYMVDIDHVEHPGQIYSEQLAGKIDALDIMVIHMTPSQRGLRVVCRC